MRYRYVVLALVSLWLLCACAGRAQINEGCSEVFTSSLKEQARRSAALVFEMTFDPKDSTVVGTTEIPKVLAAHDLPMAKLPDDLQEVLKHKDTQAVVISKMYPLADLDLKMGDDTTRILFVWDRGSDDRGGTWTTPADWEDTCPDGSAMRRCYFGHQQPFWLNPGCTECYSLLSCRRNCRSSCPACPASHTDTRPDR